MSKLHLVKEFGDAIKQPFAQKLLGNYEGMSLAAQSVLRQKIQCVGGNNRDLSKGFKKLDDILNDKFSGHDKFRKEIPKGFELDKTFHFAFNPSTMVGMPLQEHCFPQEGQIIEVEAFGWALRDTLKKKIYIFFKGTVFKSTEGFASTGTNKLGFNNDDTEPASVLIEGMPGEAKGSNARWMSSRVKYIDTAGNESVLIKSMADQMREYAHREDLDGYEIILVAHSVGTTELAIMYTQLGLAKGKLLSALALCIGPYRIYSKDAVEWMNEKAPGPWLNLVNGNDFITFASTILGSVRMAYLTRPPTTEERIKRWLELNPFSLPGQTFGYEIKHGVGLNPVASHSLYVYGLSVNFENFPVIQPLEDSLEGFLGFKSKSGKAIMTIQPFTEEELAYIAMLKLEHEGYL